MKRCDFCKRGVDPNRSTYFRDYGSTMYCCDAKDCYDMLLKKRLEYWKEHERRRLERLGLN